MATQEDFFRDRADEARRAAAAADLDNVRDRNLRAADAWQEMADRARRTDRMRAEAEAKKAEALALAAAE